MKAVNKFAAQRIEPPLFVIDAQPPVGRSVCVQISEGWRAFAEASGAVVDARIVGTSYFGVDYLSDEQNIGQAQKFAEGVRATLRGDVDEFAMETTSHWPSGQRWFNSKADCLQFRKRQPNLPGRCLAIIHFFGASSFALASTISFKVLDMSPGLKLCERLE